MGHAAAAIIVAGLGAPAGPPRTPHCPLKTLLTLSCRLSGSWQLSWWPDPNLLC